MTKIEHYLLTLKMNDDIIFAKRKYFYEDAIELYEKIDDCVIRTLFYENSVSNENIYVLELSKWDNDNFKYEIIKRNDSIF